jgi:hypothetical protein
MRTAGRKCKTDAHIAIEIRRSRLDCLCRHKDEDRTSLFLNLAALGDKWDKQILGYARHQGVDKTVRKFGLDRRTVEAIAGKSA